MAEDPNAQAKYGADVKSDPVNDRDWSWLIIPFVVFCLCIPAMLPSFQASH
jgi:hypothetical protein